MMGVLQGVGVVDQEFQQEAVEVGSGWMGGVGFECQQESGSV